MLEVGCGPGIATAALAERGLELVAVELGEALAAAARRNLARFSHVRVVNAPFESWQPDGDPFAAVVSFAAFHWIDPEVRYARAAAALAPGGALAIGDGIHVLPEDGDPFFREVQADYDAVGPGEENPAPPDPSAIDDLRAPLEESGHFRFVEHRRYRREIEYSAPQYLDLLDTFSGHRALDAVRRADLHDRIRRRIDARPGGRVRKSMLFVLNVARRV